MTSTRFTLRQLDIFAAVMQTGQVRAAAEALHLGQAAVSQALRELAEALETPLFVRRGRQLEPTPEAHRLLALTRGPRAALTDLPAQLHGTEQGQLSGPIHIAASSTIARYLLPAPIARLSRAYPELQLTLSSGNSAVVEQRIAEGRADFGFIEGPTRRDDIASRRWHTDQLTIIGPPEAPAEIDAAALDAWPWVAREAGSGTRVVFEHSLALAGLPVPPAALTVDDSGAQVRAVAAGAGLACVSRAAATAAADSGRIRFITLPNQSLARPLWAIRRSDTVDTPLLGRLLAALTPA
ncbi:LysR substrate-binding domain-containing protein [Salinisphaera sp. SPP-AMP-43]|uniref:LysR substrate-binding domain-containing protein n=1 Tax=Salinisphaera sp. SPP-AMP-43 TaxID=3121288 RepID=UPI003C6E8CAD